MTYRPQRLFGCFNVLSCKKLSVAGDFLISNKGRDCVESTAFLGHKSKRGTAHKKLSTSKKLVDSLLFDNYKRSRPLLEVKMTKKYAVKPKDPKIDKFWDKKHGGWDSRESFDPDRHTTNDPDYASGQMGEDASRIDPVKNLPTLKPNPIKIVEVEIKEKDKK